MYAYIKGKISEVASNYIVIDNNGIGYLIYIACPELYEIGTEKIIYLYQYVREDEQTLYGFSSKEEKEMFLKLINVKGVGCKMAIGMFSGSVAGIKDAIERENILYLKKFPKVGEKVARQIILDLKGKLVQGSGENRVVNEELVDTLKALGYKAPNINKVVEKIDASKKIEDQIKEALKLMMK